MLNAREINNMLDVGHSRISRYEILRSAMRDLFDKQQLDEDGCRNKQILDETLTYDLYSRENMKSRPAFAISMDKYKEKIRNIFKDEDGIKNLLPNYSNYTTKQIERMTDVEYFTVDMQELVRSGKLIDDEEFIIFDYLVRNKIDQSATLVKFTLD